MIEKIIKGSLTNRLKYFTWSLVILWTGCIVASLLWNLHEQHAKVLNLARNSAQISFGNDLLYRMWAARQGGVYVPVSEHTPPNPHLNVPNRDITTSSGLNLTLVNPAYMTRQVNQMGVDIRGSRGHITSLKPIRPENGPDPWETTALEAFERGAKEVSSLEMMAGEENMRLMRPIIAEKACLKCHAFQGYKEGDIRGGISVAIPMSPIRAIEKPHITGISLAHGLLWILGISGIMISKNGLGKQILAREKAELELSERTNKLNIVADFTYDWEYWHSPDKRFLFVSPSCERITGYSREEFMRDPDLYLRIIHPDDREKMAGHMSENQSDWQLGDLEFRIIRRDGQECWIGHVCRAVTDEKGNCLGRRGSNRDITKRKQAEISLQNVTSQLQRLTQSLELRVQERTEELTKAQQRLQYLASQLLLAQEKERKRVAVELHDGLLSDLAATKYLLEAKLKLLEQGGTVNPGELNRITQILAGVMKEARRIMTNLHPSVLDELGLIAAIHWLSGEYQNSYPNITVRKEIKVSEEDIAGDVRVVVFRVMQEALHNFAKHGNGDRVDLSLLKSAGTFALMIRDNGQGFDVEKAEKGLGLESMRERVELSGGEFRIESALGRGTTIRATWGSL